MKEENSPLPYVKVINTSPFALPAKQTGGASGYDLFANLSSPKVLFPMERYLAPTGLYFEIPMGYEAQIRPRSGLAWESGITVLNSPGTIDSDYRGEIKVLLINLGSEPYTIMPGQRIAQVVFVPILNILLQETPSLSYTARGEQGFGHTGK
jgi:dUTP pyrophosphatase